MKNKQIELLFPDSTRPGSITFNNLVTQEQKDVLVSILELNAVKLLDPPEYDTIRFMESIENKPKDYTVHIIKENVEHIVKAVVQYTYDIHIVLSVQIHEEEYDCTWLENYTKGLQHGRMI